MLAAARADALPEGLGFEEEAPLGDDLLPGANPSGKLDPVALTLAQLDVASLVLVLGPPNEDESLIVLGAARLGTTRLIDNIEIDVT